MNGGLWILLIFTLLLSIPAAAVVLVLHLAAQRRKNKAARCTASVLGTVTNLSRKGIDRPTVVTVEYQANGQLWHVSESLKLRSEAIRKNSNWAAENSRSRQSGDRRYVTRPLLSRSPFDCPDRGK